MNDTMSPVNTEFRDAIDRITNDYRASVARRAKERQAREARAARLQEVNEILQAFVCVGFIALSMMFFAENAAQMTWPVQGIVSIALFLFTQACGWTYIAWVIRKYGAAFFN
jgi:hypothetical protein